MLSAEQKPIISELWDRILERTPGFHAVFKDNLEKKEDLELDTHYLSKLQTVLSGRSELCTLWTERCLSFLVEIWHSMSYSLLNKGNKLVQDTIRIATESLEQQLFPEEVRILV